MIPCAVTPPEEDESKWCPHCGGSLTRRPMLRHPCFDDDHARLMETHPQTGQRRFVNLSPSQWAILCALREAWQPHHNMGRPQSRIYLLECLPDGGADPDIKVIDVHVCKLRQKLVGTPFAIGTARGRGYYLMRRDED